MNLKKRFPRAVVFDEEPNAVELWNKKKIPMLLCHPNNVAHGLNLQYGGRIFVWYGMTYSLELYEQFNARLPRPGQEADQVLGYHILTKNTADETAYSVLCHKGKSSQTVNDAVRIRLLGINN